MTYYVLCFAQCLGHLYGAQEAVAALGLRDDIAIVALQGRLQRSPARYGAPLCDS